MYLVFYVLGKVLEGGYLTPFEVTEIASTVKGTVSQ